MREITGLILAGGRGRRMGGVNKGLTPLRGRPMVAWALERLAPQVGELLINANQNLEQYRALGYPVISDEIGGFAGPLAGLHAGMKAAHHPYVLTVPCDSPFLPADLAQRLHAALAEQGADIAVAKTGDQPQTVFSLSRRDLLPHLSEYLTRGGRRIDAWYASLKVIEVAFDDQADAFFNINSIEELNVRVAREHFAAESAHDAERSLATLADDILYHVVGSGAIVRGKQAVSEYYDAWWTAFPDVNIEIKRLVACGEWVIAENVVTATHLGPWLGLPPTGRRTVQHLCEILGMRGGLMIEETVYYDQLERIRQIGSVLELDGRRIELPPA